MQSCCRSQTDLTWTLNGRILVQNVRQIAVFGDVDPMSNAFQNDDAEDVGLTLTPS